MGRKKESYEDIIKKLMETEKPATDNEENKGKPGDKGIEA